MGTPGTSYITANGHSECGVIEFPNDGREGTYTTEPFPGSSSSRPPQPSSPVPVPLPAATVAASGQSASISIPEHYEELLLQPVADVMADAHNDGSPNFGPHLCPFLYAGQCPQTAPFVLHEGMPQNPDVHGQITISPHSSFMYTSPTTSSNAFQHDGTAPQDLDDYSYQTNSSHGSASPATNCNVSFVPHESTIPWNLEAHSYQTGVSPHSSVMGDASSAINYSSPISHTQYGGIFPASASYYSPSYGSSPGALSTSSAPSHSTQEDFIYSQVSYQSQLSPSIRRQGSSLSQDSQSPYS